MWPHCHLVAPTSLQHKIKFILSWVRGRPLGVTSSWEVTPEWPNP